MSDQILDVRVRVPKDAVILTVEAMLPNGERWACPTIERVHHVLDPPSAISDPVLVTYGKLREALAPLKDAIGLLDKTIVDNGARVRDQLRRLNERLTDVENLQRDEISRRVVERDRRAVLGDPIEVGHHVRKKDGYAITGWVLATYHTPDGSSRAVVNIEPQGFQHIYRFDQLEVIP